MPGADTGSADGARGAPWRCWIDRGGTFTDCIAIDPQGAVHTAKILSSTAAPGAAVEHLLSAAGAVGGAAALPPGGLEVELGSTVATNALLERRGVRTLLVAPPGFGDVLEIGTQERPELFELAIVKPRPLPARVIEAGARRPGLSAAAVAAYRAALVDARAAGCEAVAVVALHAYLADGREVEEELAAIARACGFGYVALSGEVVREQGLLARTSTAAVDAYLTPLLRAHVSALEAALPGAKLRFMQSSGGLTDGARYRGPNALLSGPAGGVVAAARVARDKGEARAVGFDMGGTSTDVSLVVDAEVDRAFESEIGGVRVRAPMLRIHTIAAGGGSLCRFDGFGLQVGPESAGSDPGPLCYGIRDSAGTLAASELALTDLNCALGRVQPDRFPFVLERAPVAAKLAELEAELAAAGLPRTRDEIAAGFIEVANASMAQAIAQVSVGRGIDPRDCALVGFGGAAGQHVCAIARALGMKRILLHPWAGLLSAYGIGIAPASWDGECDAGRVALDSAAGAALPQPLREALEGLLEAGRGVVHSENPGSLLEAECTLELRYVGTDAPLAIHLPELPGEAALHADTRVWRRAFDEEHARRFGYVREERAIEVVTARVRVRAPADLDPVASVASRAVDGAMAPAELRRERVWFAGLGWCDVPVYERETLGEGTELVGPLLVLEDTGTIVVEPAFRLSLDERGVMSLDDEGREAQRAARLRAGDPVRLEVFGNRFMSIAEQMGAVLRNTAVSTNIKERLDYSCAVFDPDGGLIANAPHIPVHLGAMGDTVRAIRACFPADGDALRPGDVVATNDPFAGGSHLPDVTVVTPVFLGDAEPRFYVASRGHHADIGGTTPGSMPPDSTRLAEEGVVLPPFRVVSEGRFAEAELERLLTAGPYPARRPEDNRADLEAMIAANRAGEHALAVFTREQGREAIDVTMRELQAVSAAKVGREIARLPDGDHPFSDTLDDGTPIAVVLRIAGDRMTIDFSGTGPASRGNLNAPRAVVHAAVIYVLRSLVAERIPLNGGCLEPVEILIPTGSILDPPAGSAVVGGNVETSQRVVDVLLGALGVAAASQGTMNNLSFGTDRFGYYETIGGGAGAGPDFDGASGVHTHMTNTRITDVEVLESRFPVEVREFGLRRGSGGAGRHRGGDGVVRKLCFTAPVTATLLTERRGPRPFGLAGGAPGAAGENALQRAGGQEEVLPAKCRVELAAGDTLIVRTPGGGGYGTAES